MLAIEVAMVYEVCIGLKVVLEKLIFSRVANM